MEDIFSVLQLASFQCPSLQYLIQAFAQHEASTLAVQSAANGCPVRSSRSSSQTLERRDWCAPWWLQFQVLTVRGFKVGRADFLSPIRFYQVGAALTFGTPSHVASIVLVGVSLQVNL